MTLKTHISRADPYRQRIEMFGELNIENSAQFLNQSKDLFQKVFRQPFSYRVDIESVDFLYLLKKGKFRRTMIVQSKGWDETFYLMKAYRKKYQVKREEIEKTLNLKRILQSLNSPFCVRLEKIALDNSYLYLLQPFMNGGDVFYHLRQQGKFNETLARFYASQIVLGLEYLHHLSIIHRDIKPENMSLDHLGYLKITNFNLAKYVTRSRTYTFCGTLDYLAPEVVLCRGYGKAVDWWCLGVLLYEMTTGRLPFTAFEDCHLQRFNDVVRGKFNTSKDLSEDLKDLLRRLLQADVTRRFGNLKCGAADVKFHRWFRETPWTDLLNRRVRPPWSPCSSDRKLNTAYFPDIRPGARPKVSRRSKYDGAFDDF